MYCACSLSRNPRPNALRSTGRFPTQRMALRSRRRSCSACDWARHRTISAYAHAIAETNILPMTVPKMLSTARRHPTALGCSAPMPAIRPPRPRTRSTARISPRGQTGLSVAFDLPTQTGYDSDHELARGEVGKVGVPVCHLGDMRALFDAIPLEEMNTSMTINATAPWLLALYVAVAEEQGADIAALQGTVQNDIIKEYLSPRHLHLPARALLAHDHRRRRLDPRAPAALEPDERLLLPPAGGRRDARAGAGLRAGHRHRRPRRPARQGPGRALPADGRPHLLLRERRHPLRHRDVQDARLHRALGRDLPRPLRRRGPEATAASATACRSTPSA